MRRRPRELTPHALASALAFAIAAGCMHAADRPPGLRAVGAACFDEQVKIDRFCIDKYEDYVVEVDAQGREHPHSPYDVIGRLRVRAKVAPLVVPQAYVSALDAKAACAEAGKRMCTAEEYVRACRGPNKDDFYPYGGQQHRRGVCNEGKGSFVAAKFGADFSKLTYAQFNDPSLDQMPGGLARTGEFDRCVSPEGLYDMDGNLDEWVDEPLDANGHGHFRGGWYGDAEVNGPGCLYVTSAHEPTYHDYSLGFRCCADAVGP